MLIEALSQYSPQQIEDLKKKLVLKPLNSVEELRAWMYLFFNIDFPSGTVYPTSTHAPADAMWRIYELMKTGKTQDIPQVTMLSSRDSFKCSIKGTKILYPNSIKNIEDVKIGDVIWSGKKWQRVTDWIDDGEKTAIKITTSGGHSSIHSPIHRLWALRDGIEQWIEMQNLNPKTDLVCINLPQDNFTADKTTKEYEIGYFLGLLAGDGTTTQINNGGQFGICTIDKTIRDFLYFFNDKYFKGSLRKADSKGKRAPTYYFRAGQNVDLIKEWGIDDSRSNNKKIPAIIWNSKHSMVGFLNGLFDTDGTFNNKGQIEISITANKLLADLQILLNALGINCYFKSNKKKYNIQKHVVYRVYINGNDIERLYKVGFEPKSFKKGSRKYPSIPNAHDTIPISQLGFLINFIKNTKHIKYNCRGRVVLNHKISLHRFDLYDGISCANLIKYTEWLRETIDMNGYSDPSEAIGVLKRLMSVLSNKWFSFNIEQIELAHFYDLTVEEDHSYWSNGFISHNTLSAAAIEVLCLIHFKLSIAHAAAVIDQSDKAVQYANSFFRNLNPYLEFHGWKRATDNKKKIEWITDTGESIYLRILVMSIRGMNSEHCPILVVDEIDVVQDARALKEAKMVPSVYKEYFPLTIYLSTRKFAGGLMEKTLKETLASGGEVLRWNILDVTERITPEQAQIDKPKITRYISRFLPNENLSPEQWEVLPDEKKHNYERFEAYAGIANHPLLPVMRNYLVDRPQDNVGGLYKPLVAVNNNFKQVPPDMGEAQLLCNKPSSSGLVYPRFDNEKNILSVKVAIQKLLGEDINVDNFEYLKDHLKSLGVTIIGGGDWGYTDYTALVIIALMPGGEAWLLDTFTMQHLELDDIVKYGKELQDTWNVDRWYVDQNYPAYLKTLKRKAGMKCPSFTKVVEDGITGLQGKIVDSSNIRRFFVIDTPNNRRVVDAFGEYKWQLDGKGEIIEGKPYHDKEGVSDIMDSIRYVAQNLFVKGKKPSYTSSGKPEDLKPVQSIERNKEIVGQVNSNIMKNKIAELATKAGDGTQIRRKGKIFWS